jgi:hypothetical protein
LGHAFVLVRLREKSAQRGAVRQRPRRRRLRLTVTGRVTINKTANTQLTGAAEAPNL